MLFAHSVFFTVADTAGAEGTELLLRACRASLTGFPGQVSAAFGVRATGTTGEMADHDFDVAVHLVFDSEQSFAAYAVSPRHIEFVSGHSHLWSRVRDFDAVVDMANAYDEHPGPA